MSYTTTVLNKAQAALDAGNKAEARNIIKPIVEAEPSNARAWYLLADATEDEEQRFYYKTRGDQARTAMETAPAVPQVAPVARMAPPSFAPIADQRAKIQLASEIAACERRIASAQSEISLSKRRLASFLPALRNGRTRAKITPATAVHAAKLVPSP
jgi:hypothetical protein